MYARVATFRGTPDDMIRGLEIYEEQVLPWANEATGYRGWGLLLDRKGETALALTFWATEEDARENEPAAQQFRDRIGGSTGVEVTDVGYYEVVRLTDLPKLG
jgi:hypothetical protein